MIRIQNLTFTPGADSRAALLCAAAKALRLAPDKITELRSHRRSVDARKKQDVRVVYTVDVTVDGKEEKILQMARNPRRPSRSQLYMSRLARRRRTNGRW